MRSVSMTMNVTDEIASLKVRLHDPNWQKIWQLSCIIWAAQVEFGARTVGILGNDRPSIRRTGNLRGSPIQKVADWNFRPSEAQIDCDQHGIVFAARKALR